MKNYIKIIILIVLLFLLIFPAFIYSVNSTSVSNNSSNIVQNSSNNMVNSSSSEFVEDEDFIDDTSNRVTYINQTKASNPSADVSAIYSLPESSLGLANILSIVLIVIGILLILLAIAILIRLKN